MIQYLYTFLNKLLLIPVSTIVSFVILVCFCFYCQLEILCLPFGVWMLQAHNQLQYDNWNDFMLKQQRFASRCTALTKNIQDNKHLDQQTLQTWKSIYEQWKHIHKTYTNIKPYKWYETILMRFFYRDNNQK